MRVGRIACAALLAVLVCGPSFAQAPAVSVPPLNGSHPESFDDLAEVVGRHVSRVEVQRAGRTVTDPRLLALVETRPGAPLSLRAVRESVLHFFNTGLFENVDVVTRPSEADHTIALIYRLTPVRAIEAYEFTGTLSLDERTLRRAMADRLRTPIPASQVLPAAAALEAVYRQHGFLDARVSTAVRPDGGADTSTLVFTVESGARARVGRVNVTGKPDRPAEEILRELRLTPGNPFDGPALDERVARLLRDLRSRGFYEADLVVRQTPDRARDAIDLVVDFDPGPLVTLVWEGDPIPGAQRAELVPVGREASVDEDLLEDSKRRIEEYLHRLGHWKAEATYRRQPSDGRQALIFNVRAGPIFHVSKVEIAGVRSLPQSEVDASLGSSEGKPFVESELDARTAALIDRYRRDGFRLVRIVQTVEEAPLAAGDDKNVGRVVVRLDVQEGPRTVVDAVRIVGNETVASPLLEERLLLKRGAMFYEPLVSADRDGLETAYRDRGFHRVRVDVSTEFSADGTRAVVSYTVNEGAQVLVDRVLIIGNRRTSTETIERALTLQPGEPLGLSELVESQRRLRALGLFRRVTITDVGEPGEARRDLLVTVEEAPPTTLGYGAGIEGGRFLRSSETDGPAEERLEIAARGFVEVSRRNLWGSNRSLTLFARASLRPNDDPSADEDGFGFNEYRVLGTFREPSVFGTSADGQAAIYFEQAVRSSFNFVRRGVQADVGRRVRDVTLIGGYSLGEVRLFDERIAPEDRPAIDRLFPQVRLSKFTMAARRDARDDVLDPTRGTLAGLEVDLAARAIGSQVGFVKGFGEFFAYRRLPRFERLVAAVGVRVGLARGLTRDAVRLNEDGEPVVDPDANVIFDQVQDLPASERFFAGGDTTVRGFARDSLGDVATLDPNGFPTGGNALLILNGELRVRLWRELGGVVFTDVGNVFRRVSDFDLGALRASAGVGVRYKSPIGPVRFDVGFKLNRRELSPGHLEPGYALHFSIGQAF
jgi:outer membrane protein insertion porin family